jgi:hypothetical protein
MSRFLVFSTVFYVLGIILGRYCISLPVSFYLALAALAWVLFNLLSKRDCLQTFFPFFIIFLAAGSMAYNLSLQQVGGNIRNFAVKAVLCSEWWKTNPSGRKARWFSSFVLKR